MLTLVPGSMGGSETYARELLRTLGESTEVSVRAVVPENASGFASNVSEIVIEGVRTSASTAGRLRSLAAIMLRSRSIRRAIGNVDVVHYPFTVPVPAPAHGTMMIQTLLDVQHLDLPELFSSAELLYRRRFYEGAAYRADLVITISEFAKRRMVELLGISEEKVRVAPLGVDLHEFTVERGARENFVLYPARGWPHKNHARLIEAMRLVRLQIPDIRLVLTGGGLETLGELPDWVERKGLVSRDELRALYGRAAALAFPSLYEGFGLPPLEAMASGCPVAASNAGSIPEVCGRAAVLFDPHDPEAIAAGILEAITRGEEMLEPGLAQAGLFTWERCRDAHIAAYKDVA